MAERDTMEFDVVIVGAGPAGLACAIHLKDLVERHNKAVEAGGQGPALDPEVVVLEKGKEVGAHIFSGAVMDPRGLDELLPDWRQRGAPVEAEVTTDEMRFLTAKKAIKVPFTPPSLHNHGFSVVSLNKLVRWLGTIAEEKGVSVFSGFPGRELVMDGSQVKGVQLADSGVDKHGKPKGNYQPGAHVLGKVTVLAEGSRGSLTKTLVAKLGLQGQNPQVYATGVKEVWEVPKDRFPAGGVLHTMGWPLPSETFGGGWVYGMGDGPEGGRLVSVGFVTGLDYQDPSTDPHWFFQLYKTHPRLRTILEGGKMLDYGAKSLPEGGLYAMPRQVGDGFLLIGDSGGFLNGMRLKGIHLAFRSGILAAQAIFEVLKKRAGAGDGVFAARELASFAEAFEKDWSRAELLRSRNFHQGFHGGRVAGLFNAAWITLTGGKAAWFRDRLKDVPGHTRMVKKPAEHIDQRPKLPEQGTLTFDKLSDVYASGTMHDEDQPCHLVVREPDVCVSRCTAEYGNPCQYFCPASVYEMVAPAPGQPLRLRINASNCVHCKTCDIADPYQVIDWVTPEGGGGPGYRLL